jgi:hypothetical protein
MNNSVALSMKRFATQLMNENATLSMNKFVTLSKSRFVTQLTSRSATQSMNKFVTLSKNSNVELSLILSMSNNVTLLMNKFATQ